MAIPITDTKKLKVIGQFAAAKSQTTKQAPFPSAADNVPGGVLPGFVYDVYFTIKLAGSNILWLLLASSNAKPEWARAEMDTGAGEVEYGVYQGPLSGAQL